MIIYFDTKPLTWTDVDIVDEGYVPILLSLEQMRNLRFTLEHTPECDFLTCDAFDMHREPLKVSTTNHLVLDLLKFCNSPKKIKPTPDGEICFQVEALGAEKKATKGNPVTKEGRCKRCMGLWYPHTRVPGQCDKAPPGPLPVAGSLSKPLEPEDSAQAEDEQLMDDETSEEQKKIPSSSSKDVQRTRIIGKQPEREKPPEQVINLSLKRIHKKLERPEELVKLHIKHHHTSTAQVKKRTSALKISTSILEKI
jgi:hypothetical protein